MSDLIDEIVQKIGFFPALGMVMVGLAILVIWIGVGGRGKHRK